MVYGAEVQGVWSISDIVGSMSLDTVNSQQSTVNSILDSLIFDTGDMGYDDMPRLIAGFANSRARWHRRSTASRGSPAPSRSILVS